jgi:hypothetical protein
MLLTDLKNEPGGKEGNKSRNVKNEKKENKITKLPCNKTIYVKNLQFSHYPKFLVNSN